MTATRSASKGRVRTPSGELVGYAHCSTAGQDLTAQRQVLRALGVPDDRIYLDHGLTGRNRNRPGLAQALAALRNGDTLVCPSSTAGHQWGIIWPPGERETDGD